MFKNSPIFLLLILQFFTACSEAPTKQATTEAEAIYNEAKKLVDSSRYIMATEKLNLLRSKYPYSFYATHAELLAADILFLQDNYIEAAAAYILFRDFHPKHEKLPYVIWKIAESYYNQLPSTFDRDLSTGDEAIKYYEEILDKYAQTEYSKGSSEKIDKIKKMKKEKDLYIADFYFKTEVYDSAIYRYKLLLSQYSSEDVTNLAMLRITKSSFNMKDFDKCIEYAENYIDQSADSTRSSLENLKKKCENEKSKS